MQLKLLILPLLIGITTGIREIDPFQPQTICRTEQGTKHVTSVPTSTRTHKETSLIFSTKCEQHVITITPTAITSTINATTILTINTTLAAQTDSIQVVVTNYETTTITLPVAIFTVNSILSTDTTIYTISTISTPAGFTPVQDTLPGITDPGSGTSAKRKIRNRVPRRRERQQNSGSSGTPASAAAKRDSVSYPIFPWGNLYPQMVVCEVTTWVTETIVITKPRHVATITANTPMQIVTNLATITNTNTIVPNQVTALDTSTTNLPFLTTIAPNTTVTATTTLYTATVQVPESTFIAMCESNNFGSQLNGQGFDNYNVNFECAVDVAISTGEYSCCMQCFYNEACLGFALVRANNYCYMFQDLAPVCSISNVCSASIGGMIPYSSSDGFTVGNGLGLQWTGTFQVP